jgi:hypothetical protein
MTLSHSAADLREYRPQILHSNTCSCKVVVVRTYNERIDHVQVDSLGKPNAWTWRNRRYVSEVRALEYWVEATAWWRDLEAPATDGPGQVEHWMLEATSDHASGQVELAYDQATSQWRLVGIVG